MKTAHKPNKQPVTGNGQQRWETWYAAVIVFLLVLIIFFTWFTKHFS